jgi:hypothetical protein
VCGIAGCYQQPDGHKLVDIMSERIAQAESCPPREIIRDVLVGGMLVGSGMIRRDPLVQLIIDDQAGREDHAKQIWQLLTLELWYRNTLTLGVSS